MVGSRAKMVTWRGATAERRAALERLRAAIESAGGDPAWLTPALESAERERSRRPSPQAPRKSRAALDARNTWLSLVEPGVAREAAIATMGPVGTISHSLRLCLLAIAFEKEKRDRLGRPVAADNAPVLALALQFVAKTGRPHLPELAQLFDTAGHTCDAATLKKAWSRLRRRARRPETAACLRQASELIPSIVRAAVRREAAMRFGLPRR